MSVNDTTLNGKSVYYLAANNLGMNRVVVDSTGKITNNQSVTFAGAPAWPLSTPFVLNSIDPTLMAIGGNKVYISQDTLTGADAPGPNSTGVTLNLTNLGGNGKSTYALAYGTKDNTNALLAGLSDGSLWMSTSNAAGSLSPLNNYLGNIATSLAFDLRTQQRFFVADSVDLWGTTDQGASFQTADVQSAERACQPACGRIHQQQRCRRSTGRRQLENAANVHEPHRRCRQQFHWRTFRLALLWHGPAERARQPA